MLLAYPTAEILRIENGVLCATNYRDLDHYKLTRDFLSDPNRYLRRLFCEEE
jgi:Predicted ATPase